MFEVYATIDPATSPAEVAALAKRAEAIGYDGLFIADGVHDGFLLAAMALQATSRLKVTIAVLVAFPRSPMVVAHSAWDLQALSGGRFELGLGPQVRGNIRDRYGMEWYPPAPRMREYVNSLRVLLTCFQTGETPDIDGEYYHFHRLQPFFNPGPIEHPEIPIYLGGVGPNMTALAGEVSNGLITHPTNSHPRYIQSVTTPSLEKGAARVGRNLDEIKLLLTPFIASGSTTADALVEREKIRKILAFVYSTPAYWPCLELFGWADAGKELRRCTLDGRWDDMTALITDEMLDEFLPMAVYPEIGDKLCSRFDGIAGAINFPLPQNPLHDKDVAGVVKKLHG